ncbi:MAG: aminomethyl-transferring glycine dehydrogenase subunit GcvPA [Chloroflexi bacterium]|nr:aminomethyl-transferring glycine dehydrogenase subunit GcvPA [Chloroflexota bacterium]
MAHSHRTTHPYIPNSVPAIKEQMLRDVGLENAEQLHDVIPDHLRFKGELNLPPPCVSEHELKQHVTRILSKNRSCEEYLSFLGAGCWQHYVPFICDEIVQRAEFLTAYGGGTYTDHGKWQAGFECASMIGELVGMDAVAGPTYDWAGAVCNALRMAARIVGRRQLLLPRAISADRLLAVENYARPDLEIQLVGLDPATGGLDLARLRAAISPDTAAVYFENPSYIGPIETQAAEIARIAHEHGALCVVGVDPSSLGILAPPADYGADIVCGELQPFGIHMQYGGGLAGFIATPDDARFVMEYPGHIVGVTSTRVPGELGFAQVAPERTSYSARELGKDYGGTTTGLYAIAAAVYLSLIGPQGLTELGEGIMQRSHYAIRVLSQIEGARTPVFSSPTFKEFVVNFDGTGMSVAAINKALLDRGIFGGKDLTAALPELGNSALYCVTEVHSKRDIDRLAEALGAIVRENGGPAATGDGGG